MKELREALTEWLSTPDGRRWIEEQVKAKRDEKLVRDVLAELGELVFFATLRQDEHRPVRVSVAWMPDGVAGLTRQRRARQGLVHPLWLTTGFRPVAISRTPDMLAKLASVTEFGRGVLVCSGDPGALVVEGVAKRYRRPDGGIEILVSSNGGGVVSVIDSFMEVFRYERGFVVPQPPPIFANGLPCSAMEQFLEPIVTGLSGDLHGAQDYCRIRAMEALEELIREVTLIGHGGLVALAVSNLGQNRPGSVLSLRNRDQLANVLRDIVAAAVDIEEWTGPGARKFLQDVGSEEGEPMVRQAHDKATRALAAGESELCRVLKDVARLSALDNALLLGPGLTILEAGYPIPSQRDLPSVFQALDPVGRTANPYNLTIHGSRHRAAAAFAHAQPGSIAFVVSADGPVKCFLQSEDRILFWPVRFADV